MRTMKIALYFAGFNVRLEKTFAVILRRVSDEKPCVKVRSFAVSQDNKVCDLGIDYDIAANTGCSYEQ